MAAPKTLSLIPLDPISARWRFKFRGLTNVFFVLGLFIPLAFIFAGSPVRWIFDLVLIALLFYFYFFILENRAIGMFCTKCHKFISSNTPWFCGFCQKRNDHVDDFPFVYHCEHCGAEPKAYHCHHGTCDQLNFLSKDGLTTNFARCVGSPVEEPAPTEEAEHERKKRQMERELVEMDLTAKLNAQKEKLEFMKKKTPREKNAESLDQFLGQHSSAEELADARKAEFAVTYKDNPEKLKRYTEYVDEWLKFHGTQ